jgi:hypothetical protein
MLAMDFSSISAGRAAVEATVKRNVLRSMINFYRFRQLQTDLKVQSFIAS